MQTKSNNRLKEHLNTLKRLLNELSDAKSNEAKLEIFEKLEIIKEFKDSDFESYLKTLSVERRLLIKSLIAIYQAPCLLALFHQKKTIPEDFIQHLEELDRFYGPVHGVIVYQMEILRLILENEEGDHETHNNSTTYLKPEGNDLSVQSKDVMSMVRHGISEMDKIGEIYPVGGAGERFKLCHPITEEPLPVAELEFLGKSLLEGLFRDLESREFLYYKLMKKQLLSPVAMMTSSENNNFEHIKKLLEKNAWFHRGEEKVFIFNQPMVPVATIDGEWVLSKDFKLLMKPSGHGVIWKLALEKGVLDWFKSQGKEKLLSRQINNPIAGVDYGLLGFTGVGFSKNYLFGFYSCDRKVGASEGMNVLSEKHLENGYEYKITNIEYTELLKKGIEDCSSDEHSKFSKYPANTNILFVDIKGIEALIKKNPIPGKMINMKSTISLIKEDGRLTSCKAGRLESMMQNLADSIVDFYPEKLKEGSLNHLKTYITFHPRNKTLSVTKKSYEKNGSTFETPEGCFYDVLKNQYDLLKNYCGFRLPEISSLSEYLEKGPSFMMTYHPALGPIYSVIAQKIRKGILSEGSELKLEIAEVDIENLHLEGSLLIEGDHIHGSKNQEGEYQYGYHLSKCTLKNVKVKNLGMNRQAKNVYWKNEINRFESLEIHIHGSGEFIAEDVTFIGDYKIEVMDGECLTVSEKEGEIVFERILKMSESEYWSYKFDENDSIRLERK